ncbi:MAG: hypothetical protein IID33_10210, partial [Planctomycetes bacterium]|nr:hypothetical protein [Planctomycetota bacterium]
MTFLQMKQVIFDHIGVDITDAAWLVTVGRWLNESQEIVATSGNYP